MGGKTSEDQSSLSSVDKTKKGKEVRREESWYQARRSKRKIAPDDQNRRKQSESFFAFQPTLKVRCRH